MARERLGGKKTLKVTSFLEEFEKDTVKDKVDIVNLFNEFGVNLTKKGKSYIGLCPWHEDKKPSLSVDREKGLYNCFGCGEAGDVFSLVEKIKSCDFRQALKFLKERAGKAIAQKREAKAPGTKTVKELSLTQITDYYHKKLYETNKARSYLEKRGITNLELYTRFKLGYSDGSLLKISSNGQKEALKVLGLIRDKGTEHFYGCITFPILDNQGQTLSMYGRSIASNMHLYLPGPHKGVFNRKASKVYEEIILTESIIDALSLIQLGIENVQSCYGTNGFTEEHLEILKNDRVKTIVIAFDNDEAGKVAAAKLKEMLLEQGFAVKQIFPLKSKDWNEYLLSGGQGQEVKKQIQEALIFKKQEQDQETFKAERKGSVYTFKMHKLTYRLIGVKEIFVQDLKVNIKAGYEKESYYDKLDLYSARARTNYSNNLSSLFQIEPKRIEKDLIKILEYLEEQRDKALSVTHDKQELSLEQIRLGEKFLKNPAIFKEIVADMEVLGYVGEEVNKLIVYLVAVSRLLTKPLSVYIQAGSSSGKSYLLETLRKLMPRKAVKALTSFSDQSLNYLKEEDFLDKVFIVGEAIHNEVVEAQIRQMQSENELSRLVTLKDPKTGELSSREIRHKVRIAFMMSSTALYLNPENASRCLVLHVDESAGQTEKVLKAQRHRRTFKGIMKEKNLVPEIIEKHRAANELLNKVVVFNPFAPFLKFPRIRTVMRRAQEQFLSLIDASCILRQLQKQRVVKKDPYTGKEIEGIECDIEDYRLVYVLFTKGVMSGYYSDLPQGAKDLYELIRGIVKELVKKEKLKATEITFIQKQVREKSMLGADSVRKYIQLLVSYEYLQVVGGKRHGTRFCYRLREDKSIEELDISVIPTPEEMERRINEQKKPGTK